MHPNNEYRELLRPMVQLKLREFHLLGYKNITENLFWVFLIEFKWKGLTAPMRLHQAASDVLSVKMTEYMDYASLSVIKKSAGRSKNLRLDKDEIKELF